MKTRTAMLAAVLAVLLLAVAAVASGCGSASASDEEVAELDDSPATTSDDEESDESDESSAKDEQDPEEAALAWAKCMREHGVDVPDPEVDGGRVTIRPGAGARRLDDVDSDAFRGAQEACGSPFGRGGRGPALTPEQREEMQEAMLGFAKCMREHGVDMPDPEFSSEGGRMLFRQQLGKGGIDPESETFRKAQEACQDILEDAMPGDGPRLSKGTE